ncbi:MAG TPA: fused MFS/spermidine synthase [Candidatus Ozemobacteraceae bacterium]|nr:fused MFS/spermidine synthase [Candidatus Ozemobacteraceae bacterium]
MRPVGLLFAVASGLGAFLTFLIQPMAGKALLPAFGGAPAVWAVCLAFFQTALLAGYGYAHLGVVGVGPQKVAPVHLLLLLGVMPLLPLDISRLQAAVDPGGFPGRPEWALLFRLLGTLGLPCVLLAATAPLLQNWFLVARGDSRADPYQLYSASNIGSFAALLAYPFVVEPSSPLALQARWWSVGFAAFILSVFACMLVMAAVPPDFRAKCVGVDESPGPEATDACPGWMWFVWSAIPASLLAGMTTHITTDVAPLPLFWVVPLAAYLLSFVIVFAPGVRPASWIVLTGMPVTFAVLLPVFLHGGATSIPVQLMVHLAAFFTTCLVFHGMLASTRPPPGRLTSFYLTLAAGGATGGLFNGIAAPCLFSDIIEYPAMLVAAALLFPASRLRSEERTFSRAVTVCVGLMIVYAILYKIGAFGAAPSAGRLFMPIASGFAMTAMALWQPSFWGAVFAVSLIGGAGPAFHDQTVVLRARSFYGAFQVVETGGGRYHLLQHGNIHHGGQRREAGRRNVPMFYYSRESPVGRVFREMSIGRRAKRVAVVGLGTGGIAAYGRPWQRFVFYEIDPLIIRIANDPELFSFLQDTAAKTRIVAGDARVNLEKAPDGAYDLIILDAYSSDAIPMHLLTREAIGLYMRKLSPSGLLLFHISNRYLDLEPVLGAIAASLRLVSMTALYDPGDNEALHYESDVRYVFGSKWMLIASQREHFGQLARDSAWRPTKAGPPGVAWSDAFSSIWQAYRTP